MVNYYWQQEEEKAKAEVVERVVHLKRVKLAVLMKMEKLEYENWISTKERGHFVEEAEKKVTVRQE